MEDISPIFCNSCFCLSVTEWWIQILDVNFYPNYFVFVVPEDKPEDTCCRCPKCYPTGFFAELKNIARLVWPMVILCEIPIFTIIFPHFSPFAQFLGFNIFLFEIRLLSLLIVVFHPVFPVPLWSSSTDVLRARRHRSVSGGGCSIVCEFLKNF